MIHSPGCPSEDPGLGVDLNLRYLTSGHELWHATGKEHDFIFNWECEQINSGRVPGFYDGFNLRQNIIDHRLKNGFTSWHD